MFYQIYIDSWWQIEFSLEEYIYIDYTYIYRHALWSLLHSIKAQQLNYWAVPSWQTVALKHVQITYFPIKWTVCRRRFAQKFYCYIFVSTIGFQKIGSHQVHNCVLYYNSPIIFYYYCYLYWPKHLLLTHLISCHRLHL